MKYFFSIILITLLFGCSSIERNNSNIAIYINSLENNLYGNIYTTFLDWTLYGEKNIDSKNFFPPIGVLTIVNKSQKSISFSEFYSNVWNLEIQLENSNELIDMPLIDVWNGIRFNYDKKIHLLPSESRSIVFNSRQIWPKNFNYLPDYSRRNIGNLRVILQLDNGMIIKSNTIKVFYFENNTSFPVIQEGGAYP